MPATVLLLATEGAGEAAADALRRSLDAEVKLLPSLRAGLSALRLDDFSLVLLDETLAGADPEATDRLYQLTAAPVLELNLAISSAPRVVRQARAALVRRSRDLALAQTAAAALLHGELNQTLSGILLESELALRQATPAQEPKLRELVQLASHLRDRLRSKQEIHG
jgi:hypothetical protein